MSHCYEQFQIRKLDYHNYTLCKYCLDEPLVYERLNSTRGVSSLLTPKFLQTFDAFHEVSNSLNRKPPTSNQTQVRLEVQTDRENTLRLLNHSLNLVITVNIVGRDDALARANSANNN